MTLLEAALDYAAKGWPVFPLKPMGKKAFLPGGFHQATTEENQIRAWWSSYPNANIGVPCRDTTFTVVDMDPKDEGDRALEDLCDQHGFIPETLMQQTGSGGVHYLFKFTPEVGNTVGKLGRGIDTRGDDKGYIVMAPSIHESGKCYSWINEGSTLKDIPNWLIPKNEERVVPNPAPFAQTSTSNDIDTRARAYLKEIEPATQGAGGHSKLLWACTCMVHGFELDPEAAYALLAAEYNPRCAPPWDLGHVGEEKEFRRKIEQATQIRHNKPRGWLLAETYVPTQQDFLQDDGIGSKIASQMLASFTKTDKGALVTRIDEVQDIPSATPYGEVDILKPPGILGDLCTWMDSRAWKKQPILSLGNAIAFLGALYGRKVRDERDLRTNIYCLGIGESGCGKENSRGAIKALCVAASAIDQVLGGEDATSDAALLACIADRKSCLFQWDEVGHMIASMTDKFASSYRKTIVPLLMKLYSSANTVFLGKEYTEAERKDIIQPNACLYGTTVPQVFYGGLSSAEIRDGFLSRMLVFTSKNPDPDVTEDATISEVPERLAAYVQGWMKYEPETLGGDISSACGLEQVVIPTKTGASDEFRKLREKARKEKKLQRSYGGTTGPLWSRVEENARKVALIVAVGDAMTPESASIETKHARYACALVLSSMKIFEEEIRENISDNQQERTLKGVLKLIKDSGKDGITKRNLTRQTQNITARQREDLIKDLIEAEYVIRIENAKRKGCKYYVPPHGVEFLPKS